jgi:hypothetical protein
MKVTLLNHLEHFKHGTRILKLVYRNKDGDGLSKLRPVSRVSENEKDFMTQLTMLSETAEATNRPYRIYACLNERCPKTAIRLFKQDQLAADNNPYPEKFYTNIKRKWNSSLLKTSIRGKKYWKFDCDSEEEYERVSRLLSAHYDKDYRYEYHTKNGIHIVVEPFFVQGNDLCEDLIEKNSDILWEYGE